MSTLATGLARGRRHEDHNYRGELLACVSLLLLAAILAYTVLERPYRNGPPIRSDGVGYHLWTYALTHRDFSFCEFRDALEPVKAFSSVDVTTGRCQVKYPPGVGLMQLPFVVWTIPRHGAAIADSQHLAILLLGGVLLMGVAVLSFLTARAVGGTSASALVATGTFVFGSGLFHYATYDASFSHIYSAFVVSLAMWLVVGVPRRSLSGWRLLSFGVCVLELSLIRQTNALISISLALLMWHRSGRTAKPLVTWGVAQACAVLLQISYNSYARGTVSLSSYGTESFVSFGGHALDVLVSWERGLVTYYPVFGISAVLGLWKARGPLVYGFVGLIGAYAFLYGSWWVWHLAGGMGHRGFVELAPMGAVVLALTLPRTGHDLRMVSYAALLLGVYVTVSVMLAYWSGAFPFGGATYREYLSALRLI